MWQPKHEAKKNFPKDNQRGLLTLLIRIEMHYWVRKTEDSWLCCPQQCSWNCNLVRSGTLPASTGGNHTAYLLDCSDRIANSKYMRKGLSHHRELKRREESGRMSGKMRLNIRKDFLDQSCCDGCAVSSATSTLQVYWSWKVERTLKWLNDSSNSQDGFYYDDSLKAGEIRPIQ